jgi:hypothetical protein
MLLVHRTMGGSARIASTTRGYDRVGPMLRQALKVTNWYEYSRFDRSDASEGKVNSMTWTTNTMSIDYKLRNQTHGSDVWVAADDLHCEMKKNETGIFVAVDADQCP